MPVLKTIVRNSATLLVLACLLAGLPAYGQSGLIDRVRPGFETLRDWLDQFGGQTEDVIPPVITPQELQSTDITGLATHTRTDFDQQYAADRFHTLALSNSFGNVRVQSWENHVIRVMATIVASAESEMTAAALAQSIAITVDQGERQLTVNTVYPDTQGLARIDMKVNYDVYLPRDTNVVCNNRFGDTEVVGIAGEVSVDSLLGGVKLERIGGMVTVRTRGEFPVTASGLASGGSFFMRGATAQFSDIGGQLFVDNNDGSVELRELQPVVTAQVVSNNGPIHVYVSEEAKPDIEALVLFGSEMQGSLIQSDFPLDYPRRGTLTYARMTNPGSTQKIDLQTSFASINIHQAGQPAGPVPFEKGYYLQTLDSAPMTAPCPDGFELVVDAMPGNVRIRGGDVEEVTVSGTRIIRLERQEDAQRAQAAMELHVETIENRLHVRTDMLEDLQALGAVSATLNLDIVCPRTIPVRVAAENGETIIEGTGDSVSVTQSEGRVEVQHCKGALHLTNKKGDIKISECEGPVVAIGSYGTVNVFNVFGRVETQCYKGTTIVEAAQGEVVSRNEGGDVRIIATELIGGNYDVAVEEGNISIILSPTANATLFATTKKGVFYNRSTLSFSGTKVRDVENFSGTFGEGLHNIKLNAISGDVIITQEQ